MQKYVLDTLSPEVVTFLETTTLKSSDLYVPSSLVGKNFHEEILQKDVHNYWLAVVLDTYFKATGQITPISPLFDSEKKFIKNMRKVILRNFNLLALMFKFKILDNFFNFDISQRMQGNSKKVALVLKPRGTHKSVLFGCLWVVWQQCRIRANDDQTKNYDASWMIIHGDLKRGSQNMGKIRDYLRHDFFQLFFSAEFDFSSVEIDNTESIKFAPLKNTAHPRAKEPNFMLSSPNADPTGAHVFGALFDDYASSENTDTIDKTISNKEQFFRFFSLEDHLVPGGMKIIYIGTPENDATITHHLLNDDSIEKDVMRICVPAIDEAGEMNFPQDISMDKFLEYKRLLPSNQFASQYLMRFYKLGSGMEITSSLPTYYDPPNAVVKAIMIDPAVSKKQKTACLMPILVVTITNGKVFVVDGEFNRGGMQPSDFIDKLISYAAIHKPTYIIIEAVAAQTYMADHVRENMQNGKMYPMTLIEHRHTQSKSEHIRSFLEPLFNASRVHINPKLQELIDEVEGKSSYVDGLDCLAFLKEIRQYLTVEDAGDAENKMVTENYYSLLTKEQMTSGKPMPNYKPMFRFPR